MKNKSHLQKILSLIRIVAMLISIISISFLLLIHNGIIVYSSTPSIKYGFFFKVGGKIKIGDLVIFENPRQDLLNTKILLKRVTEINGEFCVVSGRNSEELEKVTGISNLDSFDSKYFGEILISKCTKVIDLKLINYFLNYS